MKWSSASRGSARHASAYVPTAKVTLQVKTAVITGASTGIGRASALRFAQEGARLVLADVQDAEGEALAQAIARSGGTACFVRTDVSRRADNERMIDACVARYGRLDILFCNAGINLPKLRPLHVHGEQDGARGADRFAGVLRLEGRRCAAGQGAGARLRHPRHPRERVVSGYHRHTDAAPFRGRDPGPRRRLARVSGRAADATPGHARRVRRRRALARVARGRLRHGRRTPGRRRLHRHVSGHPRPMPRPTTITRVDVYDIRFPTSRERDGSDAMNPDPDYSAAYVLLRTDHPAGREGHGLTFTIGRGNELCVAAVHALAPLVQGLTLEEIKRDMARFWRRLTGDSQLRWVGPEKGVVHLATAALVNAVWDLYAKVEGKPLWQLPRDMTPEELVRCIDFRYLSDALTPQEGLDVLRAHAPTRAAREAELRRAGYPAYTTSAGWLGYPDEKIRRLCRDGGARG